MTRDCAAVFLLHQGFDTGAGKHLFRNAYLDMYTICIYRTEYNRIEALIDARVGKFTVQKKENDIN